MDRITYDFYKRKYFLKFVYDKKLSYIYLSRKYNKFINYENRKR